MGRGLCEEFNSPYFYQLVKFIKQEYDKTIFPPGKLIFNAFNLCPFDKVKVVILGQDPYHNFNQAHGVKFLGERWYGNSAFFGKYLSGEIESELSVKTLPTGNLERWAKQGVLLLNADVDCVSTWRVHTKERVGNVLRMR